MNVSDFERFDPQARRAVVLSESYAHQHGSPLLSVDHLALALLTPPVVDGLQGLPTFEALDSALEDLGVAPGLSSSPDRVPFTPELRLTIERSRQLADDAGDPHIGPEHLLVAVLRSGSTAAVAFARLGVDPERSPMDWRSSPSP